MVKHHFSEYVLLKTSNKVRSYSGQMNQKWYTMLKKILSHFVPLVRGVCYRLGFDVKNPSICMFKRKPRANRWDPWLEIPDPTCQNNPALKLEGAKSNQSQTVKRLTHPLLCFWHQASSRRLRQICREMTWLVYSYPIRIWIRLTLSRLGCKP